MRTATATTNQELQDILNKYNCNFVWSESSGTWCLYGTDNGNAWETDDYDAETIEQAAQDAIEYLTENNGH